MLCRLVLGYGPFIEPAVDTIVDRPGQTTIIAENAEDIEHTAGESLQIRADSPLDSESYPTAVDSVLIDGGVPDRAVRIASLARQHYPEAFIIGYVGATATDAQRAAMRDSMDRLVEARKSLVSQVSEVIVSPEASRLQRLFQVLRSIDGTLGIIMHDAPDPDAIASGLSLAKLAETVNLDSEVCYFGDIDHQENKALVNLLDLDLRRLTDIETAEQFDAIALVDHSRPGVNDGLSTETPVDLVIDHHTARGPIEGRFVDLRNEYGATSTIFADYIQRLSVEIDEELATALLYGIRTDTNEFTREVSAVDFDVASSLLPRANLDVLSQVESPLMSASVLDTLARAVKQRNIRGDVLLTNAGQLRNRDTLAQASDLLVHLDDIKVAVVYGICGEMVYVSGRAMGADIDLGEVLSNALGSIGNAGGHAEMAGAQVSVETLANADERSAEALIPIVTTAISTRVFEAINHETAISNAELGASSVTHSLSQTE